MMKETPPTYDSQSNGGTEVGVRIVRGLYRTIKLCLEERLKTKIPEGHPLTSWILNMVSVLTNVRVRGKDGKTAWERVRGRPFNQKLIGIGQKVLYKLPTKGLGSKEEGNMGTRC